MPWRCGEVSYEKAQALDKRCVQAICDMNITEMETQEACGKLPVLALMHLAKLKGWKAQLLDYRNSGDTAGRKDNVVGYSAIAFYEAPLGGAQDGGRSSPPPQGASREPSRASLGEAERKLLLALARRTVASVATNGSLPEVAAKDLPPRLAQPKGCFVTLTEGGDLRGCIGHLIALEPLCQAVIDNARNAAVRDTRFRPVQSGEVAQIKIEISVLTEPQPLAFSSPEALLAKLHPHEDGVVLRIGPRSATFLPQVWEQIPGKEEFLSHLSVKAGCPASAWRGKETSISIYHVECFQEN
jgi:AmmeMemoRadiSam system protein A